MIHEIKRCKHCYRQYSYQASGDGCFNPVNDKDYCPECMSVINEALSKIAKKFEPRFRMVEMGDDFYKNNLLPLKEKYEEYRKKKGYLFEATKLVSCNKKYKDSIIEGYYFNNAEFIVEKYDDEMYKLIDENDFNYCGKKILRQAIENPENAHKQLIKLEKCKEMLEKTGDNTVNYTDPEARKSPNKNGIMEPGYNEQIVVDNKNGIIIAVNVSTDGNDTNN